MTLLGILFVAKRVSVYHWDFCNIQENLYFQESSSKIECILKESKNNMRPLQWNKPLSDMPSKFAFEINLSKLLMI
jgi:predicted aldo/keto reductase-like oxidoreductase